MISDLLALDAAPLTSPVVPYELTWFACDFRTGGIIEELPALTAQALSRRLGTYTTTTASLTLAGAPRGWESATSPGLCMLVAVDTARATPIWAGIIMTRTGGSAQNVDLGLCTPERYLDSRYTGTVAMVQQDQAAVVAAVMSAPLTADGPCFQLDAPTIGTLATYSVADADDRTVLSSLQELMGAAGGPEFTIDVAWADAAQSGFVLPVRVRSAIGSQSPTPEGTFDFPGAVSTYTLSESYETGKGATVVVARGEGEGTSRVTSDAYSDTGLIAAGWARWVYRYTPASGITDPAQLNAHAAAALALMRTGSQVWSVEASASRAPRLGTDWGLGDTIRVSVEGSPRHPAGADIAARAWSWSLDAAADKVTPILVEED